MASFARAQLLKYGWTEGKGLGKNESGITVPLKPKLKFDTAGIGHDTKEHNWWESVYNKAANNIDVIKTDTKGVSVNIKDKDSVEISTNQTDSRKLRKDHNLCYGSFLKTATLENGRIMPEKVSSLLMADSGSSVLCGTLSFTLSDEELFAACNGRTAHKGARHGLSLGGKLTRIAQQERELLAKSESLTGNSTDWTEVKNGRKKSKRKRQRHTTEMDLEDPSAISLPLIDANANNVLPQASTSEPPSPVKQEKTKNAIRKEKRRFQSMIRKLGSVLISTDDSLVSANRTKKRKLGKEKSQGSTIESCGETEQCSSAKKRKRKNGKRSELEAIENDESQVLATRYSIVAASADGTVITVVDEDETIKETKKRKKDLTEVEKLNYRIEKTKLKRQAKKETRRVDRLSECLMAVNLCEDSVDSGRGEDLLESCETSKKLKKWKKHKKVKRDKKTEENSIFDL